MGSATSPLRTADQTDACRFWESTGPTIFWDRAALRLGADRGLELSDNARLLATLNLAIADAVIACWDAKYHYEFWRPVTAIPLADDRWKPRHHQRSRVDAAPPDPGASGVPIGPFDHLERGRHRAGRLLRRGHPIHSRISGGAGMGSVLSELLRGDGRARRCPRLRRLSLPDRLRGRQDRRQQGRRLYPRQSDGRIHGEGE